MTLEQLTNLSDDELNRMAAEKVMGWTLRKWRWVACEGTARAEFVGYSSAESPTGLDELWHPATDRNQSGELLAKMTERGASFEVDWYGREHVCTGVSWNLDTSEVHGYLHGNDARAETLAALMAHFAMEETAHAL